MSTRVPKAVAGLALLVATLVVTGCAQHARVMCEPLELVYRRDPAGAVAAIDRTKLAGSDRDSFLYHAQKGQLLNLAGDFAASNREFERAVAAADALEPWSATETLTDYTFNETVKAYAGEDYERAYVHYYMALNYLDMDDLEGALVECRRVDEVFRLLDSRYEDDGRYQDDGFIRYLSGLIYESQGRLDDALVDYRLAVRDYEEELGGETGVAVPDDLAESVARLDSGGVSLGRPREGRSEIVVIIDSGWAPYKREESVEVPIHRALVPEELRGRTNLAAYVKIAYPEMVSVPGVGMRFRAGAEEPAGRSATSAPVMAEKVQDLDALAKWTLERRMPAIVLRSTLRATAKQVALAKAKHEVEEKRDSKSSERSEADAGKEKGGLLKAVLGWLIEDLATVAVAETEQADTRSWILLPAEIWLVRIPVEPGEYEVTVQAEDGSEAISLGNVRVEEGKKAFRSARFFGGPHPVKCRD
ncbi:MAG: hypothetical protein JXB46_03690 [Candidatus Eisenbacteria bacterium]|nr:hypothetical protein [Candidatus Eisenbacteria bacterium]